MFFVPSAIMVYRASFARWLCSDSRHLCICITLIIITMAIINSLAIGKSVKSAGNLTYKTVRGRTIASQRITTNKSNTMAQSIQRSRFGQAAQAAQLIQIFINSCYEKSRYGSARNAFMQMNKNYRAFGLLPEVQGGAIPLADVFIPAFAPTKPAADDSYIEFSAYGSSPIIVREIFASAIFNDSSSNPLPYNETSRVEYSYITPVAREKAIIVVCGLFGDATNGISSAVLTSRNYSLSEEDIQSISDLGFKITVSADVTGNIIGFSVKSSAPTKTGNYEAYAVIFPVVNGKMPKLKGWMHTQVEPAP